MSVFAGPNIVENDLVLFLDAANSKSYPGTGTNWIDLSGRGNNGTMYGTVPYVTDVTRCFDFTGATGTFSYASSLGFTFSSNMVTTTGSFSFSCWAKNFAGGSGQTGLFSNAGSSDGFRFGINPTNTYYLLGTGPSYTEGGVNHVNTLSESLWYNIVGVFDRPNGQFISYINGDRQGTGTFPAGVTAFSSTVPGLVRNACCTIEPSKLSTFAVHNRALSATEIQQNFNALRGRFGI